jgi:hypothetical protein
MPGRGVRGRAVLLVGGAVDLLVEGFVLAELPGRSCPRSEVLGGSLRGRLRPAAASAALAAAEAATRLRLAVSCSSSPEPSRSRSSLEMPCSAATRNRSASARALSRLAVGRLQRLGLPLQLGLGRFLEVAELVGQRLESLTCAKLSLARFSHLRASACQSVSAALGCSSAACAGASVASAVFSVMRVPLRADWGWPCGRVVQTQRARLLHALRKSDIVGDFVSSR